MVNTSKRLGKGIGKTLATLATAGALTLGLGAPEKARALPVDWTSGSQITPGTSDGATLYDYTTTVNLNGGAANQNIALIYMLDVGGGAFEPIAEIDVAAGSTIGQGKVVKDNSFYGLPSGQNLNTGTAPAGYWNIFYDLNNNGRYGQVDANTWANITVQEGGERLNSYSGFSVSASGQPNFNGSAMSGGLINVVAPVPEPSTIGLVLTGLGAIAASRRRRKDEFKPKSDK